MLTDIDKEFETPEIDENGELIEVIEEDDIFIEEDTGLEEQPDSFYEDIQDDIVQEGEEEEELDNIQEVTVEAKENYENAKEQLVAIFLDILERGEITPEDNIEIEQVKEQYSEAYNSIKENTEVIQKKTLEERVQELADGMVGATTDEILNILTDNGRKPWLYKNEDNDVLVDMTAIPELTVLINKLFLIATDGENEGEFQLTQDFIKMIVGGTGSGNAIDSIVNKYYVSTSKTELIGGTWVDDIPDPSEQERKFLWIKTVTTFLDQNKKPQETTPICISAQDGSDGTNGKTSYFHIKYSPVPNPTVSQMSETPNTYIGTYVDFTEADSTDPAKYTWSRFEGLQGTKGEQGIPGSNGANGQTSYLHIKYSNDGGKAFTANNGETPGDYIGTCTDFNSNDPGTVSSYTWSKIKGEQGQPGIQGIQGERGQQGIPGSNGANGQTSYFHIKYSPVANPTASQMTETPSTYIGTYVDFSPSDSTDPAKYTWSRFEGLQGSKGEQGIPGTNGANGKTTYLHIKYSNDEGKTFTANNGETVGNYIGTCTDFNVNDPTIVSAYTWTKVKGDRGDQGIPGQNGVSVEEVIIQYSKGTSTSTPPADGWDTSMPSYQEGYFLWIRTRIKYSNKSDYVYSAPTCDQSWKTNAETYTLFEQLRDKINLIAVDNEDKSSITLTPLLIKLISESNIQLSAKKILIEGLLEGTGWRIDKEGRMVLQDLIINGDLTCTNLNVTDSINSPKYPQSVDSSMNIYVHEKNGDDESILKDGATFKTLSGALDSIPKNLNGKTINIQLNSDITETISTDWFGSGRLRIFFGGHTLYGTYTVYRTICMHEVYGGTIDDSMGNTGIIMPYNGKSAAGVSASVLNMGSPDVAMYNIEVYEAKTLASGCTESAGVACGSTGCMYTRGIAIVGCNYGFRTNANGIIYDDSSSGKVSKYGFIAVSGGQIRLSNGKHTGGSTGNTYESSGATVKYHSATFDGTSSSGSNTSTPPSTTTKKVTYTSSGGDTWRTTYDSWRKENIVIEGNGYGSGNCRGYWFFGSQLGQIKGSEVLTVVLKVKRAQIGAWSSKSTLKLAYHNYLSRPSSPDAPTYFASVEIGAYSGDYVSINITNSTVLKGIKEGTIKGFGLYDSSYGTYVGCSSSAKVEITYKE